MPHPESGTKIILEYEPTGTILVCQRDNDPSIPFPDMWDLPGGGIEPGETLLDCAVRELEEEFRLTDVALTMLDIIPSRITPGKLLGRAHGLLTARQVAGIVFDHSEGQGYTLMSRQEIAGHANFVPQLQNYIVHELDLAKSAAYLRRSA